VKPALLRPALLLVAIVAACDKGSATGTPAPQPVEHAAASSASAPSTTAPAASASAPAASPASAWAGSYTAKVGAVEPPKNAKEKTWTEDPGTAAIGKGTIELAVSAPHGDVSGEAKGPLGDMVISGTYDGHELRANLMPKDPRAEAAMTGFMSLTGGAAGPLQGSLRVSGRDGRIVREAPVELTKK
jgi:hypothetical protein